MMTRGTAGPRLFAALDAVGVREGRVQLRTIWDALCSWWVEPLAEVAPSDDRRCFYLSQAPAGVDPKETVFAGAPPSAIASLDLVCLEFSRDFVQRTGPHSATGLGGAGVTLWYRFTPIWDSLRATPEWIDLGISTPSYDWSTAGRDAAWLIEQIERAPVFAIASAEPALALTMGYSNERADGPDDVVVVAT
jgi:hypothetical protein